MLPSSNLFTVRGVAGSPILSNRQDWVKKYNKKSTSRVLTNSWNNTKVGQLVNLTIKLDEHIHKKAIFSVLAVGEDHIFAANQSKFPPGSSLMTFTFTPRYPGVYNLYVEEVNMTGQLQLPGSPFRLDVCGESVDSIQLSRRADSLPSCQTLPLKQLSWLDGEWITRNRAGTNRGVLRSGWVFQPSWCSFDTFTTEDIAVAVNSFSPKKIAILGSSIDRGIFLSLVDLILAKEEKYHLSDSGIAECWGFAQIQVENLTVLYQDFRIAPSRQPIISDDGKSELICHNEKEAKSSNYDFVGEAIRYISDYLFAVEPWPDIVSITIRDVWQLELILKAIPSSWSGIIYPLYNFRCADSAVYTESGLEKYYKLAEDLLSLDSRVELIDGFGIGSGMRHNTESVPFMMISNHWHKWCNELDGNMRVCGNPTEMIAQILLGKLIAPNGKEAWLTTVETKMNVSPRIITVCEDCPPSLLPFHIKVFPEPTCYDTTIGVRIVSETDHKVWDGTLCPEECMKTNPVGVEHTQSGPVDVRRCNVSII